MKPAPCRWAGDSAGRSDRRVNENRRVPFPESRSWDVCIGSSLCSVSTAGVLHRKSHFRLQRRLDTGVSGSRSSSAGAPEKEGRGGADPAWCIANITAKSGLCGATPNGAVCQLFGHMSHHMSGDAGQGGDRCRLAVSSLAFHRVTVYVFLRASAQFSGCARKFERTALGIPMSESKKREKSKKRERPPAVGGSSSEDTPPLDAADTAGWDELTTSLGAMQRYALLSDEQLAELPTAQGNAAIGRYAELGGSVVRLLLQSLELHRTLASQTEAAGFLARQRAEPVALTAKTLTLTLT